MKLTGITFNTGTNALVSAINYAHNLKLPEVRIEKSKKQEDFDNIVILGNNKEDGKKFRVLAQIHTDKAIPFGEIKENSIIKLKAGRLEEEKDLVPFAAYIWDK